MQRCSGEGIGSACWLIRGGAGAGGSKDDAGPLRRRPLLERRTQGGGMLRIWLLS